MKKFIFCFLTTILSAELKVQSPLVKKYIEHEVNDWYLKNLEKIKNNPKETAELKEILEVSQERSLAIKEVQASALEHTTILQEAWRQINVNRLNPVNLENGDFLYLNDSFELKYDLEDFQKISSKYAKVINNNNLDNLKKSFEELRKISRNVIVYTMKNNLQKRSLIENIKDKIPLIKDYCAQFGDYIWQKLPQGSLKTFQVFDEEFQNISDYAWNSIFLLEKQSCSMWDTIETSRAYLYQYSLKLIELID